MPKRTRNESPQNAMWEMCACTPERRVSQALLLSASERVSSGCLSMVHHIHVPVL